VFAGLGRELAKTDLSPNPNIHIITSATMVRTALALSLIGLGAVSALPAQTVEERQIIGGGGGVVWGPSDTSAPCQPGAPAGGSSWAPCFFPPKTGGLSPPKEKREDAHVEERQFFLPADAHSNPKKFIAEQQKRLEQLQNKRDKTPQDLEDIDNIRRALRYLAGITNISAPPGSSSTFTPGKRDEITIGSAGPFSSVCPNTQGLEDVLRAILDKRRLSRDDIMIIQQIQNFLTACGSSISDGTGTFTPWGGNDKRDITPRLCLRRLSRSSSNLSATVVHPLTLGFCSRASPILRRIKAPRSTGLCRSEARQSCPAR